MCYVALPIGGRIYTRLLYQAKLSTALLLPLTNLYSLPNIVIAADSLTSFKSRLKTHQLITHLDLCVAKPVLLG